MHKIWRHAYTYLYKLGLLNLSIKTVTYLVVSVSVGGSRLSSRSNTRPLKYQNVIWIKDWKFIHASRTISIRMIQTTISRQLCQLLNALTFWYTWCLNFTVQQQPKNQYEFVGFSCCLWSKAAHRDHFVRCLSVHVCICLSVCHNFMQVVYVDPSRE